MALLLLVGMDVVKRVVAVGCFLCQVLVLKEAPAVPWASRRKMRSKNSWSMGVRPKRVRSKNSWSKNVFNEDEVKELVVEKCSQ